MGCLRRICCYCCCPGDDSVYEELSGGYVGGYGYTGDYTGDYTSSKAYPGPRYPIHVQSPVTNNTMADVSEEPIRVNGGSQDSLFFTIREKLSSWSLPKSKIIRQEERIHKFDEFLDEEDQSEAFRDQDAVSVTSRLSDIFE